jgi:ribosome-associated protein
MTATEHAIDIARLAALAALDKLASDPIAFDVSERLAITDVFLIVSAGNERQVGAIVDSIEEKLLLEGIKAVRREGDRENRWVLMDYLDTVVHVQHNEERALYALERLWKDCPRLELGVHAGAEASGTETAGTETAGTETARTDTAGTDTTAEPAGA